MDRDNDNEDDEDEDGSEKETEVHHGRLAPKVVREKVAKEVEKKVHANKRKVSDSAEGLQQTATMPVWNAVQQAQSGTAKALDSMYWKDRIPDAPQTTMVQIFLTKMKDPPYNGQHPLSVCTRSKMLVEVVAESPELAKEAMLAVMEGWKGKPNIDLRGYYRDGPDLKLLNKIDRKHQEWKPRRKRPSMKPITPRQW